MASLSASFRSDETEFSDQSTVEAHEQQPLLSTGTQIENYQNNKVIKQKQYSSIATREGRKRKSKATMSQEAVNTPGLDQTVQDFKAIEDRDPKKLNDDVRIKFDEIIAEPEGYHSSKYIWHLSNEVYVFFKDASYQVLSLIFGIPLAAFWGLIFACVACAHVWVYSPLKRSHKIKMGCMSEFWGIILQVVFNPFFESLGRAFSSINIKKRVERVGGAKLNYEDV